MRFNKTIRLNLAKAILAHRFDGPMLDANEAAWIAGDVMYEKLFPEESRRGIDPNLLTWDAGFNVQIGNEFTYVRISSKRPVPPATMVLSEDYRNEFNACLLCEEAIRKLNRDRLHMHRQIVHALNQISSSKQLEAMWPEVVCFLPPETSKGKGLSIVPAELNKKLNLPV